MQCCIFAGETPALLGVATNPKRNAVACGAWDDDETVMILRIPMTPALGLTQPLSAEWW